jgi:hypothetical protein
MSSSRLFLRCQTAVNPGAAASVHLSGCYSSSSRLHDSIVALKPSIVALKPAAQPAAAAVAAAAAAGVSGLGSNSLD